MTLATVAEVERALWHFADAFQPASGSVVAVSGGRNPARSPFHPALLDDLDVRTDLRARLALLPREERHVLVRWYVEGNNPLQIARHLGRSVRHVYRLRVCALRRIVELGHADEFADADLAEFA